jgi:hypothetical protein
LLALSEGFGNEGSPEGISHHGSYPLAVRRLVMGNECCQWAGMGIHHWDKSRDSWHVLCYLLQHQEVTIMSSATSECPLLGIYLALSKELSSLIINSEHVKKIDEDLSLSIDVWKQRCHELESDLDEIRGLHQVLDKENARLRHELRQLKGEG